MGTHGTATTRSGAPGQRFSTLSLDGLTHMHRSRIYKLRRDAWADPLLLSFAPEPPFRHRDGATDVLTAHRGFCVDRCAGKKRTSSAASVWAEDRAESTHARGLVCRTGSASTESWDILRQRSQGHIPSLPEKPAFRVRSHIALHTVSTLHTRSPSSCLLAALLPG